MANLNFIYAFPGSGKSTFIKEMRDKGDVTAFDTDEAETPELKSMRKANRLNPPKEWHQGIVESLSAMLQSKEDVLATTNFHFSTIQRAMELAKVEHQPKGYMIAFLPSDIRTTFDVMRNRDGDTSPDLDVLRQWYDSSLKMLTALQQEQSFRIIHLSKNVYISDYTEEINRLRDVSKV